MQSGGDRKTQPTRHNTPISLTKLPFIPYVGYPVLLFLPQLFKSVADDFTRLPATGDKFESDIGSGTTHPGAFTPAEKTRRLPSDRSSNIDLSPKTPCLRNPAAAAQGPFYPPTDEHQGRPQGPRIDPYSNLLPTTSRPFQHPGTIGTPVRLRRWQQSMVTPVVGPGSDPIVRATVLIIRGTPHLSKTTQYYVCKYNPRLLSRHPVLSHHRCRHLRLGATIASGEMDRPCPHGAGNPPCTKKDKMTPQRLRDPRSAR